MRHPESRRCERVRHLKWTLRVRVNRVKALIAYTEEGVQKAVTTVASSVSRHAAAKEWASPRATLKMWWRRESTRGGKEDASAGRMGFTREQETSLVG